jgi:hypothetical protein
MSVIDKAGQEQMGAFSFSRIFFLPLGATVQGELWPPERSASILLYSSSFLPILSLSFYGVHHVHPPTVSAPSLMSISVQSEADCLVPEQLIFTV